MTRCADHIKAMPLQTPTHDRHPIIGDHDLKLHIINTKIQSWIKIVDFLRGQTVGSNSEETNSASTIVCSFIVSL